MMRKQFLFFLLFISIFYTQAQPKYDADQVKLDVQTLVKDYEKALNAFVQLPENDKSKNALSGKLRGYFTSPQVWVFNDLSSESSDTSFLKMMDYVKMISKNETAISEIKMEWSNAKMEDIEKNFERNAYTIKLHIRKQISELKFKNDTILSADSSISEIKIDTLKNNRFERLTFYLKLDFYGYTYKGVKVENVSRFQTKPQFLKLSPEEQWWVDLDNAWKKLFIEQAKLEDLPDKMELNKIAYIYNLDLKNKNINSLEPLSKVNMLTKLDVSNNPITNLDGIKNLKNLKELYLNGTKILDLTAISECKNLQILHAAKLGLTDISPLAGLTNLIEIDISENLIKDISPLKNMNLLEVLDISLNNDIETIEALNNKPNLTKLKMQKMKVKDISALSTCYKMVYLDVFSNEIGNINALRNLKKIAYLDISFSKVTSLEPLKDHRMLVFLYCTGNAIDNISVVSNFYVLKELKVGRTSVSSLEPVMKLEYLNLLEIYYSKVTVEEKDRFKKRNPKCDILYY